MVDGAGHLSDRDVWEKTGRSSFIQHGWVGGSLESCSDASYFDCFRPPPPCHGVLVAVVSFTLGLFLLHFTQISISVLFRHAEGAPFPPLRKPYAPSSLLSDNAVRTHFTLGSRPKSNNHRTMTFLVTQVFDDTDCR